MEIRNLIKKNFLLFVLLAIVGTMFSSCGVSISGISYDDVYSTSDDDEYLKSETVSKSTNYVYQDPNYKKQVRSYREAIGENESANAQVESDSSLVEADYGYSEYEQDDYYDYAYSARIRRFHSPFLYSDYYSDYYTNLYWYTYDPFYWGTSIYLGYSWWYPSYYHRWYDPFYWSWHSPYWYHNHYCHHHHWYHHHHDICYYNSHDHNSNLYRGVSTGQGYITRSTKGISTAGKIEGSKLVRGLNTTNNNLSKGTLSKNPASKPAISSKQNPLTKPARLSSAKVSSDMKRPADKRTNKLTNTSTRKHNNYNPPTQRKRISSSSSRTNRQINRSSDRGSYNRDANRSYNRSSYRSSSSSRSFSSPSRSSSGRSMGTGSRSSSSSSSGRSMRR